MYFGGMMQKTKYLTAVILFLVAFLLIGEFFIWRLYTFPSEYPSTTVYLQEGQNRDELLQDIISAANEVGIDVFAVDTEMNSAISAAIHIYGTANTANKLKNRQIEPGSYSSLFLGKLKLDINPIDTMPTGLTPDRLFLTGSHAENVQFKQLLINKYAGNIPQPMEHGDQKAWIVGGLWLVVFSLLLIISLYHLAFLKREGIVRMISGEPLGSFVLSNIIRDTAIFAGIFFSLLLITSRFTKSTFLLPVTVISFAAFAFVNAGFNARLLKVDFRKDAASKQSAKNVLKISYVYKCAAIILTIFAVSGNVQLIKNGADYYSQKTFFQQHNNYYYLNISTHTITDEDDANKQILVDLISNPQHLMLVDLQVSDGDLGYVYTDSSTIPYLKEQIPELSQASLDSKVYFIVPESVGDSTLEKDSAMDIWSAYYKGSFECEFIEYEKASIMAIKNMGTSIESSYFRNPIVVLNNLDAPDYTSFFNLEYIAANTLFDIPDAELQSLDQHKQINYSTNACENYTFHLDAAKRNIITGLVFMGLILILNLVMSKSMLYFEYKVRAVEYLLKKILGVSLLKSNVRVLLLSAASVGLATVVSSALMYMLGEREILYNIVGSAMVLLMDVLFSVYYIHAISRISLIRVFKGGSI